MPSTSIYLDDENWIYYQDMIKKKEFSRFVNDLLRENRNNIIRKKEKIIQEIEQLKKKLLEKEIELENAKKLEELLKKANMDKIYKLKELEKKDWNFKDWMNNLRGKLSRKEFFNIKAVLKSLKEDYDIELENEDLFIKYLKGEINDPTNIIN